LVRAARPISATALNALHPIAQFRPGRAGEGRYLFHQPRQDTVSIAEQAAVGRVVDIGFHYRCVHAHFASLNHFVLHRQRNHSLMNLLNDFRTERLRLAAECLVVWNFSGAMRVNSRYTRLARASRATSSKAPVPDVLE
jgi:hypothetical protein